MVFFIVACHLANKEDEEVGQILKNQISSQGARALGEVYDVDVPNFQLNYMIGGQEKVQNWNFRLLNGTERDLDKDRYDFGQHCQEDRKVSKGNCELGTQN